MACWNLRQAHLQEVGLTQIPADHGSQTTVNGWQYYFNFFSIVIFYGSLVYKRQMAVSCKCLEALEVCSLHVREVKIGSVVGHSSFALVGIVVFAVALCAGQTGCKSIISCQMYHRISCDWLKPFKI